jgi:hypothetical protein
MTSALDNLDEDRVTALALTLIQSPVVQAQRALSRERLLADPAAASAEGMATLDTALDHLVFASALGGANSDPVRPAITWTLAAARPSFGRQIAGSKYLIDNPDTVYRFIPVDGNSRYDIRIKARHPGPAQYSFMLHDTMFSEDSRKELANLDQPIAGLRDIDIVTDDDGSFTVTIDSAPADSRINHIRSTPDARLIWFRNSLDDWASQYPQEATVVRLGGPVAGPEMSPTQMAEKAAAILKGGTDWLLALMNRTFGFVAEPNMMSNLFGRGGSWGYAARANFKLAPDEVLLVTLAPPVPDSYVGFQLTDRWQISLEYIRASGSLNNAQVKANDDGSITYVISPVDPGVHNWLDTEGLHEGGMLVRWQTLPDDPAVLERAVR